MTVNLANIQTIRYYKIFMSSEPFKKPFTTYEKKAKSYDGVVQLSCYILVSSKLNVYFKQNGQLNVILFLQIIIFSLIY